MSTFKLSDMKGVIPAMLSTFDEREALDAGRAKALAEYLIGRGVHGLYLTGSTGEGFLMTGEERNRMVDAVLEANAGRVPVVVHVGDMGTKKSIELARHAERAGADAISSVPPFYWRFGQEDIYQFYADLAGAVSIPMVVYNVELAVNMGSDLILRLAGIENVQGLKYTSRVHDDMAALKDRLGPDFMVYSGCDQMASSGLLAGADGLIGSYYNLMPETFLEIYRLARAGQYDQAMAVQKIAARVILAFGKYDFYCLMRHFLREADLVDAGYSRKPFQMPSGEAIGTLEAFLRDLVEEYPDTHMDFVERLYRK